ncbi:MAG TPA: hypothetical protein VF950_01270 [Planctomycetota bacterium]
MARSHRTIRVALLIFAGCAAPAPRPETEPILPEDLAALPAVTKDNARDVVRKCLQRHAAQASDVHRRYGYRFHADGFERVLTETFSDGRRDRGSTLRISYAGLGAVATSTRVDPTRLRRVTEVVANGWTVAFDDPDTALALARALELLQAKE